MKGTFPHHRLDVGIVGAGPAGAHLGRLLARSGHRVTIYDHRAPWEKACGGGAPHRAVAEFGMLQTLPHSAIRTALLESPSGRLAAVNLIEPLVIFSRTELFREMLRLAASEGAVHVRRRVLRIEADPDGRHRLHLQGAGPTSHDLLVGADGARSLVRRTLSTPFQPHELTQAAGYYTPKTLGDQVLLRFCASLPGYVWYFPRPDHASVGICAPLQSARQGLITRELDLFCQDWGIPKGRSYGALIPCSEAAARGEGIAGIGWALIGDAAGIVDPITREGIYYAVKTAELLASAVVQADSEPVHRTYERLVRSGLAPEMQKAHRLESRFYRPRFTRALVSLTARSPRIRQVMADLLACRQGYVGLKRRLLRSLPVVLLQVITSCLRRTRFDSVKPSALGSLK